MSKIALTPNASGTGTLTIAAPNTSTDRTLTLPDETGTVLSSGGAIDVDSSAPADSINIDSSGNVGVNNTSPAISPYVNLNVKGGASGGVVTAQSSDSGSSVAIYSGNNSSDHPAILYQKDLRIGSTTGLGTAGYTERMRIDSSGNVTTPYQPAIVLNGTGGQYTGGAGVDQTFFSNHSARGGMSYNASNGRLTLPVTGWYCVMATFYGYFGSTGEVRIRLRKNGGNENLTQIETPSNHAPYSGPWDMSFHLHQLVGCSAGDYLTFFLETINGGSNPIYGGSQHSYASIFFIG